ncbi:MAG: plastocyanin/azurin family copper-binding protein [Pseudomonadota bacterium]
MTPPPLTRRRVVQISMAACCCGGKTLGAPSPGPRIDQITDPRATAATNMFRFAPDLVVTSPGTEITFLNSRGEHTVHSVPQLWPEGVDQVGIRAQKEAGVRLSAPGLYGFRCQRHGKYGMVMLVVAGEAPKLDDVAERIAAMTAGMREKAAFANLIERYRDQNG